MRLARFLSLRIGLGLCGALALLPLVLACRNQTTDEKLAAGEPTQAGVASMTDDSGSTTRRTSRTLTHGRKGSGVAGDAQDPGRDRCRRGCKSKPHPLQYESGQEPRGSRTRRWVRGGVAGAARLFHRHDWPEGRDLPAGAGRRLRAAVGSLIRTGKRMPAFSNRAIACRWTTGFPSLRKCSIFSRRGMSACSALSLWGRRHRERRQNRKAGG